MSQSHDNDQGPSRLGAIFRESTVSPDPRRPTPKPGLLDISPYVGGKSKVEGAVRTIKLSSNENPLGLSPLAAKAYAEAGPSAWLYPDGRAEGLRAAVAAHFGLEPERLVFGNGSDEIFTLVNQAYVQPGDGVVCGEYGFLSYRISARAMMADLRLAPEPDLRVDVDALLALVDERTKVVFVSNPSNPTGSWLSGAEMRRLHAGLPPQVLLVVDEAYAEYVTEPDWESCLDLARGAQNVLVTRTFSKIHGLAGLRVGFAYAPFSVADALDRIRLCFNCSIPAQAAAIAALGDHDHVARSRDLVTTWKPRLAEAFAALGFKVYPSAGNFLLVRFASPSEAQAADLFLQGEGVIVRPVGAYGLPDCLRITVGTQAQNLVLIAALTRFEAQGARAPTRELA